MAFTALTGATDDVADVTLPDLGIESSWDQVYRVRPRPDLRCRQCRHPMHAKVSPRGHRFFSHDTGADCASAGESAEHQELKLLCAQWSRDAGWRAEPEYTGPDWRADVLATAPDGRRIAWEIQVSPQHADHAAERTAKYTRDGIECVWIALGTKSTDWFRPNGALVTRPVHPVTGETGWTVTEGCLKHHVLHGAVDAHSHWAPVEQPVALERIVRSILGGQLVPRPSRLLTGKGTPWWWVRADESTTAGEISTKRSLSETLEHHRQIRARQQWLREQATVAARTRWPWLTRPLFPARLGQTLDSTVFGELVAVVFGGRAGIRPFALLLPDVIAEDELAVPVLVDTVDAARAIAGRFPAARIAVVEGTPPWPLLRYDGNRTRPAGAFGQPAD